MTSIPNLHISTFGGVKAEVTVYIQSRDDFTHAGTFIVQAAIQFDPSSADYPTGEIRITVDMSDSAKAIFNSTSIELINSFGKHNPTIVFTGRCEMKPQEKIPEFKGCKYWMFIADNRKSPSIIGFVIIDNTGRRIAYGTGTIKSGRLEVQSND